MYLLIFEFLGTNELVVILVVALILLGPRRLPQISRKLGKSMAEFKRHSEDFKRTWEREVEMESADKDARIEHALLPPPENQVVSSTYGHSSAASASALSDTAASDTDAVPAPTVMPVEATPIAKQPAPDVSVEAPPVTAAPTRKRDWL